MFDFWPTPSPLLVNAVYDQPLDTFLNNIFLELQKMKNLTRIFQHHVEKKLPFMNFQVPFDCLVQKCLQQNMVYSSAMKLTLVQQNNEPQCVQKERMCVCKKVQNNLYRTTILTGLQPIFFLTHPCCHKKWSQRAGTQHSSDLFFPLLLQLVANV